MADTLYNTIGTGYNKSRQADSYLADRLYELLAATRQGKYMDIGCGTGNYTIALATRGIDICGLDPSDQMLGIAREREPNISWIKAKAEELPFREETFDGLSGVLTLHHWTDLNTAFREIYRVLKPGGRAVFFTSSPLQMEGYWLNHYFPQMIRDSIRQMPSIEALSTAAESARLRKTTTEIYCVTTELTDLFLYAGKDRPHLYLNDDVRIGISSFASLAVATEVTGGLARLSADISSGDFSEIQRSFSNDHGDYLFVVFEK